jgi:hypothetical protein
MRITNTRIHNSPGVLETVDNHNPWAPWKLRESHEHPTGICLRALVAVRRLKLANCKIHWSHRHENFAHSRPVKEIRRSARKPLAGWIYKYINIINIEMYREQAKILGEIIRASRGIGLQG